MDIEQLRLILETVQSVSGDAALIAIAYICIETIVPFIGWMGFLYVAYKIAIKFVSVFSDDIFIKELGGKLGVRFSVYCTEGDKNRMREEISKCVDLKLQSK